MTPTVILHHDAAQLAAAVAARLITKLLDLQSDGLIPAVALTGGTIGIETLRHVAASAARDAVDWRAVDLYFGDERFVPAADDDRNAKQAREALLDQLDLDPVRVHEMPASDGQFGDDVDAAAASYGAQFAHRAPLDVVLLGMGEEGHVASIFPHSPASTATEPIVAVRDCPKPPPTRISMTYPTITAADEVWLIVAGESKAAAVGAALGGAEPWDVPSAGARGRLATYWLLDRGAASQLPPDPAELPV